jgi:hypothetical protein
LYSKKIIEDTLSCFGGHMDFSGNLNEHWNSPRACDSTHWFFLLQDAPLFVSNSHTLSKYMQRCRSLGEVPLPLRRIDEIRNISEQVIHSRIITVV